MLTIIAGHGIVAQDYGYLPPYEKDLRKIDEYYQKGAFNKSLSLSDSVELLIKKEYGDTNYYYGYFISQNPAMIYEQMGNFSRAEKEYKRGIGIMQKAGGDLRNEYAEGCVNLGNLYNKYGLLYQAKMYLERGRETIRVLNLADSGGFAAATNNLANVNTHLGNFIKAESLYDTTLQLITRLELISPDYGARRFEIYNNLATLYNKIGDNEKAGYYYEKAYSIIQKNSNKRSPGYNTLLINIGTVAVKKNELQKALGIFTEVRNNLGDITSANLLLHLSNSNAIIETLLLQNRTDSALSFSRYCIELFKSRADEQFIAYNHLLSNYARILMQAGNWQNAASVLEDLVKMFAQNSKYEDAALKTHVLTNLARVYLHTKKYQQAIAIADSLWTLQTNIFTASYQFLPETERMLLASALHNVSMIYAAAFYGMGMKNIATAAMLFEKQSAYKGLLLQKQNEIMRRIRASDNAAIQQRFEEWKSNNLFLNNQYKLPKNRQNKFTDSIAFANEKIEKTLKLNDTANTATALFSSSFDEAKRALGDSDCLLQFVRFSAATPFRLIQTDHYGAFIIKKNRPVPDWVYLGEENAISKLVQSTSSKVIGENESGQFLIDPRLKEAGKLYPADKLYNILFKPLLPFLKGVSIINCISDGIITQIPLEALPATNKKYATDNYIVRNLLSIKSLTEKASSNPVMNTISLWGGIDYGRFIQSHAINDKEKTTGSMPPTRQVFGALPWSEPEVNAIRAVVKEHYQPGIFTKKKASEDSFKSSAANRTAGIIHISTHGYSDVNRLFAANKNNNASKAAYLNRTDNPLLNCGLVLAGANNNLNNYSVGNQNDGLLTGYEIASMDLSQTELVVMSACETGLGKISETEGVLGLQRAFKLAGAKKILMTLWKVNDRVTYLLMAQFYKYVAKGIPFELALKKAKMEIRKKYPSPYFWAGFALVE